MDNLVLISVAGAIRSGLCGATLTEVRVDGPHRWRLLFEFGDGGAAALAVSLRPELPWIGRPALRLPRRRLPRDPLAAEARRSLRGSALTGVTKPDADRSIDLEFGCGHRLVAELATHRANLILVDPAGRVVRAARHPRSGRGRVEVGAPYVVAPRPARLLDPHRDGAEAVDAWLARREGEGDTRFEALRRGVFGVGSEGARLLVEEAAGADVSVGTLLVRRLRELEAGERAPVIVASRDPLAAVEDGVFDAASARLLPWSPSSLPAEMQRFVRDDPAATAGLYHDAAERSHELGARTRALRGILGRELERIDAAERRAAGDLAGFEDPDRHRHHAEALLAGLGRARIVDGAAIVPDPYDAQGRDLVVPIAPQRSLPQNAEALFQRHRRALRGVEQARRRAGALAERRSRLLAVVADSERVDGAGATARLAALEQAMRAEGIPVGLEPETRAGRAAAASRRPRLEGVRMVTSSEGLQILIGRSGRDNHRLTFDLAAPDDFWLHVQGCSGAHVVVRNPLRARRPPEITLREAAAAAAWFSEARRQGAADVQWTLRKYVRRPRGAAAGTVVVKRSETVRVRPAAPPADGATAMKP